VDIPLATDHSPAFVCHSLYIEEHRRPLRNLGESVDDRQDARKRLRASDHERQEVVELLKVALDDGRLKMDEYVDRMGRAYEAVTYGELAVLHDDLPASSAPVRRGSAGAPALGGVAGSPTADAARGAFAQLPTALKVLWTIWFAAVSINVVVWVLVGVTGGHVPYPWPLWVAGPAGAALFGVSAGVRAIGHGKPPRAPKEIPPA
jgi:hypothetical protein